MFFYSEVFFVLCRRATLQFALRMIFFLSCWDDVKKKLNNNFFRETAKAKKSTFYLRIFCQRHKKLFLLDTWNFKRESKKESLCPGKRVFENVLWNEPLVLQKQGLFSDEKG